MCVGDFRFRFGGMFAHAPCWRASSLIQSASYPPASNIVCGSNALRRTEHGRLSVLLMLLNLLPLLAARRTWPDVMPALLGRKRPNGH